MSEFDNSYHLVDSVLASAVQKQLKEVRVIVEVKGQIELVLEGHPDLMRLLLSNQTRLEHYILLQLLVEFGRVVCIGPQLVNLDVSWFAEGRIFSNLEPKVGLGEINKVIIAELLDKPFDLSCRGSMHVQ